MENRNRSLSLILKTGYLLMLLCCFASAQGQTVMNADGEYHTVDYNGTYQDFQIPDDFYGNLNLTIIGGDGGWARVQDNDACEAGGGQGAIVWQEVMVGNGTNEIPPGTTLRLIIGGKGESHDGDIVFGGRNAGGGGGTGVLALIDNEWVIVGVAGGGGGAHAGITFGVCGTSSGKAGNTDPNGNGSSGRGDDGPSGGTGGEGGETSYDEYNSTDKVGGGGGAFSNGDGGHYIIGYWSGGDEGWTNGPNSGNPVGGEGGYHQNVFMKDGGFGFGGGGAADGAGGGGGGYSGGGSGAHSEAGGGGGSYIHPDYSVYYEMPNRTTTFESDNGEVRYKLSCELALTGVEVEEPEACDSLGAIATTLFDYNPCVNTVYFRLLNGSGQYVTQNSTGIFTDLDMGTYSILLRLNDVHVTIDEIEFEVTQQNGSEPPIAICQDLTVSLVDNHEYLLSAQELDGGSTDACEISSYSILEGTFPSDYTTVSEMTLTCEQYGLSNFTQTLVVTDNLGGTAICVSQITVLDAAPPTLPDYPTATAYLNQQGSVDLDHEDLTFESTDCTPASEIYYIWNPSHDDYDCSHLGTVQTLEFTATDTSDNTTTGTMYITILDTLAPTVIPQNVTINLDATGSATIDYSAFIASASDNCLSEAQIISGYSWDESQLPLNVSCEHIGSHEITLLSAPVAHESQLPTVTATVTIRDGAGPEIVCNDNTIHVGDGVYHFTLDELPIESVSDLCYDTSELTYNWKYNNPNVFFNCNDVGVDEFAWIDVTDPENNTTRCYYTLTIADTVAPILNCINRTVYFNSETSSYTFTPEEIFGNLSSTCVSFIPGNGTVAFAEGTNPFMDCSDVGNPRTVTLIYTPDDGSDQLSCTSTLTVKNPSWPNITCPSGTIHLTATYEDCGAIYDYEYNAWDDVCPDDISVNLAQGLPSGSTFPIGDNLVRWEVTNNANRTTSCTFLVRVLHPSAAPTLECPENYTVTIGEEECNTIIDTSAIFHYEDCYVANTQFSGPAMGSSLAPGSYNFGFRTRNVNTNNSSQCTFTVTIEGGSTAPTALCKDTTVVLTSNNITLNPDYIDDGSYSLCSNISIRFIIPNKLNCSDLGSQTVTLMVRDNNFVATTCESTLTLVPKEPDCQDISVSIDDTGIASITPEDILVPDNVCNNQATLSLDQTEFDCTQLGDQIVTLTRSVSSYSNTCTATVTVDDPVGNCPSTDLLVNAKTFLEGPYDSASGLMNDDLRILDLIPSTEPYSNNGETVDASVLAIEGGDAIVDWVVIELRSELDNTEVLHSRSALLQRDGDVVDTDGVSPVGFADADPGHYYIAIRHRNHLGLMTATTRGLSTTATMIDFSADTETVYGTNSRFNLIAGVWGMYGADPDKSGMINASDRSMTWNDRNSSGYLDSDCNLDGITNASDRSATWNNRNIGGTLPE